MRTTSEPTLRGEGGRFVPLPRAPRLCPHLSRWRLFSLFPLCLSVDQRELHQCSPNQVVPLSTLAELGVLYWSLDPAGLEADPYSGELGRIRSDRHYKNHDIITVSPDKLPNYEAKIKSFFEEHLHEDEEIRCTIEGQGFFDVRSDRDQSWIRILVQAGDMIVLPAGLYHRFTLDTSNYIKV